MLLDRDKSLIDKPEGASQADALSFSLSIVPNTIRIFLVNYAQYTHYSRTIDGQYTHNKRTIPFTSVEDEDTIPAFTLYTLHRSYAALPFH